MGFYKPATSSGLRTSSANIVDKEATITGLILIPAAAACSIILYNDAGTAAVSGQELIKLNGLANGESVSVSFDHPIHANKGINAVVAGAGAAFIVLYTL